MQKRWFLAVFSVCLVLLWACASAKVPDGEMADTDAFSFFQDRGIISGWNLGNSMDAWGTGGAHETAWGNPPVNQEIMDGVKAAGFDIVRIPITWMGNIGPAPDYTIKPRYLERVAEVVGYARNAGLAVIINIHHDGATEKKNGRTFDRGWLSINKADRSDAGMKEVTGEFRKVWTQIAAYFKSYGDWLMFEPFNEIHDGNWGAGSMLVFQHLIIDEWNQVFVNAVRSTGGNNTRRFLVIPAYCTRPQHTAADYFNLPKDNANKKNKLVVTFHYYDPDKFAIEGAWLSWGSPEQRQRTIDDIKPVADRFIPQQIPVIMAEYGAVRKDGNEAARLDYITHVYATARSLGIVPIYWDNGNYSRSGERFGLFNRRSGQPMGTDSEDIINAITNNDKRR